MHVTSKIVELASADMHMHNSKIVCNYMQLIVYAILQHE